jgi:hypothetical protein
MALVHLPPDILAQCLSYLPPAQLAKVSSVCKELSSFVETESDWQLHFSRRWKLPQRIQSPVHLGGGSWKQLYGQWATSNRPPFVGEDLHLSDHLCLANQKVAGAHLWVFSSQTEAALASSDSPAAVSVAGGTLVKLLVLVQNLKQAEVCVNWDRVSLICRDASRDSATDTVLCPSAGFFPSDAQLLRPTSTLRTASCKSETESQAARAQRVLAARMARFGIQIPAAKDDPTMTVLSLYDAVLTEVTFLLPAKLEREIDALRYCHAMMLSMEEMQKAPVPAPVGFERKGGKCFGVKLQQGRGWLSH